MARPITYDEDEVTRRAVRLFRGAGYAAAGVREILTVTGLSRRALYERFGGKDGLFKRALAAYGRRHIDHIVALLNDETAGLDALQAVFDARLAADPGRGCLVLNSAAAREALPATVFDLVEAEHARIETAVRTCLARAQDRGEIAASKDPEHLTRLVMMFLHAIAPASRAGMSRRELRDVGASLLAQLTKN